MSWVVIESYGWNDNYLVGYKGWGLVKGEIELRLGEGGGG